MAELTLSPTAAMTTLADLAVAINTAHQAAEKTAFAALDYARQAGELLIEAKARVKHGEWLPWLEANCEVVPRQAQKYIKLAENWDSLANTNSSSYLDVSLNEIMKQLAHDRRQAKQLDFPDQTPDFPPGKYAVIYADPPWQYDHQATENRAIENQYPTMTIEEICTLPVNDLVLDDAILFLWTTSPKLAQGMQVITAWGFEYITCAIWDKVNIGQGYYFRQQHELLLVAKCGDIPAPLPEARPSWSIYTEKRTGHSVKPVKFYDVIEQMYPEFPKIELFSRSSRQGWDAWGNQANAA